jgi:hypothetical protein
MNNNYDSYDDNSLVNLFNKTKVNDLNRIYIYIELTKRNRLDLLDNHSRFKFNNEFICTKFKLGCFGQRGMIKDIGNKVHFFFFLFTVLFLFLLKYNFLDESLFFYSIPLSFFAFFHDFVSSNYIILTNKKLYLCKKIFFLITIRAKSFSLNNIKLFNNLDGLGHFFLYYISISINLYIFTNNNQYNQILCFSYYKNIYIFHEWLKILFKDKFNCYLFSEKFINLNLINYNVKDYNVKDYNIYDFYNIIKDLPDTILLSLGKNNIQKVSFLLLYNYLKYQIDKVPIKKVSIIYKFPFLLKDEIVIFIYKPVFLEQFRKNCLIITNFRVIKCITSDKINFNCLNYYMLSDKKLVFTMHQIGIDVIYKSNVIYMMHWRYINIPIDDLLKMLRESSNNHHE